MTQLKGYLTVICYSIIGLFAEAQITDNDILFTIDNDSVKASEFVRVYNKNLDLVKDERQKDLDEYLSLFINYKLKIKEAKALGFDQKPGYQREFSSYKKQLAKNYLTDHEVTEALVEEAYERVSYDVKASHILIVIPEHEKDTTDAYNRMLEYKKRFENEDFETLKSEIADGKTVIAEDLGYFSGFKMVYPFETVAFNTKVGQVSEPFRTRFGFHILKVFDKRKSRGEVTVGHIMVNHNQKDSTVIPSQRIQEIYKMLKTPNDFESLAKQFSDDQSSAKNGGKLPAFKSGQLGSIKFEDVAFGLSVPYEITEPFETKYGWHIVKLYEKKPMASFDELKEQLTQKVKRDSRSKVISDVFVSKLKAQYNINDNVDLSYFVSIMNDDYFARTWEMPSDLPLDKHLITIDKENITYFHFAEFLKNEQKKVRGKLDFESLVKMQFESFLNDRLLKYHEANLEHINQDYAHVLSEYRDGLLLFDLMENKVWNAVKKDTTALMAYYEKNKAKYMWPERIDAEILSSSKKEHLLQAETYLKNNLDVDEIKEKLNTESEQNIIVTTGKFAKDHRALPQDFNFKEGVSSVYEQNNAFHLIIVNAILPASQKSFKDSQGHVISDYQANFEAEWIASLKAKYKVDVNSEVMNKIKTQMSN